jgi:hypothetical protein
MAENVWEVRKLSEHIRCIGEMFLGLYLLQAGMNNDNKNWKAIDQLVRLWQAGNTFVSVNTQSQGQPLPGANETPESLHSKMQSVLRCIPIDTLTRILPDVKREVLCDAKPSGSNNGTSAPSNKGA